MIVVEGGYTTTYLLRFDFTPYNDYDLLVVEGCDNKNNVLTLRCWRFYLRLYDYLVKEIHE